MTLPDSQPYRATQPEQVGMDVESFAGPIANTQTMLRTGVGNKAGCL